MATITEIYDYLRVLYARIGRPHCLVCDREIKKLSNEEILETIIKKVTSGGFDTTSKKVMGVEVTNAKIKIFSPIVVGRKGEYYQLLYDLLGEGYEQVKIDGELKKLREQIILSKNKKHNIDVLVDELFVSEFKTAPGNARERVSEAIEKAIDKSGGLLKIETPEGETLMSVKFMCPYDGYSYPEVEPRLFSFKSPYGACEECKGLGTKHFLTTPRMPGGCHGHVSAEVCLSVRRQNIVEVTGMSIDTGHLFKISSSTKSNKISKW